MRNCAEIVREYLKKNGFDGLYCPEYPCGCGLDDFQPCGEDFAECVGAYKTECPGCKAGAFTPSGKVDACEDCGYEAPKPESEVDETEKK